MKKFKSYILVAMMGLAVTSCKDFLTLMPLNEVVLENFWTDSKDVESVLRGAYAALESSDCINRMAAWGEFRSDNIVYGADNTDSSDDLSKFINENINENNELTTYLCFYKAINYANTVLHFAPEVHAKDPNYRGSQLKAHEAEAIGIRTLCYWYLLRAFKDVPYVTIPSIDDTHDFFIGQTPFAQVLDSLIFDLDKIKDYAPIHFSAKLDNQSNSSRFTRAALYAMLADLYLWKQDWDKCIECCEFVDSIKRMEYADLYAEKGIGSNITLIANKYPLINGADADKVCGRAYNEIFGTGNSFESLFELPFGSDRSNSFVSSYYNGSNPTVGRVKAYGPIGKAGEATSVFKTQYDTRYHEDLLKSGSNYGIMKYVYQKMNYKLDGGSLTNNDAQNNNRPGSVRQQNSADPNWIVYRYSEVLLMNAEAKIMKAKSYGSTGLSDSLNNVKNTLLNDAFELIKAVNDRAICKTVNTSAPSLSITDYHTDDDFEKLVFEERRREFMFEGKRWFDLVRQAMRNGNSKDVFTAVQGKYEGNTKSIEIKFTNPNGLFLPINKDEVKINDKLIQNPAYQRTDEVIKKAQ
jgi:hypothetical protein